MRTVTGIGEVYDLIASISKICKILNCFTSDEPVLGNSEIAEKLNMNASTVHHLVRTLCVEGMLIQDEQRKYRLGWKLLEWGNQVMFQQEIYSGAIPLVEELVRNFSGTVHIGMFDRGDVVFILKVSSKESVQISTHVGSREPAYCTSTGKVLLSFHSSPLEYTSEKGLLRRAPNTITCVKNSKQSYRKFVSKVIQLVITKMSMDCMELQLLFDLILGELLRHLILLDLYRICKEVTVKS